MSEDKNNAGKGEKFLFNVHIFDGDDDELPAQNQDMPEPSPEITQEEEETPPPPPTFTQEELDAAKAQAFEEGRAQALEESKHTQNQHIANLLDRIPDAITPLLSAERQRDKQFEHDATALSLAIFKKLFPAYAKKHQFTELRDAIAQILQRQEKHKDLVLRVSPEHAAALRAHFDAEPSGDDPLAQVEITADKALDEGACILSWQDGGACKDITGLSHKIEKLLTQSLKEHAIKEDVQLGCLSNTPQNMHNEISKDKSSSDPAEETKDKTNKDESADGEQA